MRVDAWVMPEAASEAGLEGDGRLEVPWDPASDPADPSADDFTALVQLG
jgi:hypothetical protein